jgi:hypothetical protein
VRRAVGALYGFLGGASGAGCMTAIRLAARRVGIIDLTPPQAVQEWVAQRTRLRGGPATHHLLDHLIHLGVGVGGGALFGALSSARPHVRLTGGAAFGLGVWLGAFGLVVPALGIARPVWRSRAGENGVNVLAHVVWGTVTALVIDQLSRQHEHGPSSDTARKTQRIG